MDDFTVAILRGGVDRACNAKLIVVSGGDIDEIKARDEAYLDSFKEYARKYETFVVPGLYMEKGYLCLCLIDDRGDVIGVQRAIHKNISNFPSIKRDSKINIIDTPFAIVFLCVDIDIYRPEVIRAAVALGAEVIVSIQYIEEKRYNEAMILAGAWQNAQQNCVYIVNAHNFGGDIIGPCETASDFSGFIKRMDTHSDHICAKLSRKAREKAYKNFPIFKTLNTEWYKKAFK